MPIYNVEYYKRNRITARLYGYGFSMETNNIEEAAKKAAERLIKLDRSSGYNEAWDAKIVDSEDEYYEILREGVWLVDFKTGKKLDSLEGKLKQNQTG